MRDVLCDRHRPGMRPRVPFELTYRLYIDEANLAIIDLLNTAQLSFVLPEGVTIESEAGYHVESPSECRARTCLSHTRHSRARRACIAPLAMRTTGTELPLRGPPTCVPRLDAWRRSDRVACEGPVASASITPDPSDQPRL